MKPRDFLTMYRNEHRHDPGPKYDVELDMSKKSPTHDNPPRIRLVKDKIPTRIAEIEIASRKVPGPGRYENDRKRKIYGTYTYKNAGGTFTDEALYRGMCTPSHYPAVDLEVTKVRCPKFRYKKAAVTQAIDIHGGTFTIPGRIDKIRKDGSPGAASYNHNESFYKTTVCESPIKWSLNKEKRVTYTCEQANRKSSVPAPSLYNPERALLSHTVTIGARGKLGYYK